MLRFFIRSLKVRKEQMIYKNYRLAEPIFLMFDHFYIPLITIIDSFTLLTSGQVNRKNGKILAEQKKTYRKFIFFSRQKYKAISMKQFMIAFSLALLYQSKTIFFLLYSYCDCYCDCYCKCHKTNEQFVNHNNNDKRPPSCKPKNNTKQISLIEMSIQQKKTFLRYCCQAELLQFL